jgi:hypothetical protein
MTKMNRVAFRSRTVYVAGGRSTGTRRCHLRLKLWHKLQLPVAS